MLHIKLLVTVITTGHNRETILYGHNGETISCYTGKEVDEQTVMSDFKKDKDLWKACGKYG